MDRGNIVLRFLSLIVLLAFLFLLVSPGVTAQESTKDDMYEPSVQVEWDRVPWAPVSKRPSIKHGDFEIGFGFDAAWDNIQPVDDADGSVRGIARVQKFEFKISGSLNSWTDFYVANQTQTGDQITGNADGDIRWMLIDMHNIPFFQNITVGQFLTPYSIDVWSDEYSSSFIHRSYMSGLGDAFVHGIKPWGFNLEGDFKYAWQYGVFRQPGGDITGNNNFVAGTDSSGADDLDYVGRFTWLPWFRGSSDMLHLGVSGGFYGADDGLAGPFAFSGISNGGISTDPRLNNVAVDGFFVPGSDNYMNYNGEILWQGGPLRFQAEYGEADVSTSAGPDPTFNAGYAQVGYFLTGESKPYIPPVSIYGQAVPKQPFDWETGGGAWELLLRYNTADFNEPGFPGAEAKDWTAGVNFYASEYLMYFLQYERTDRDGQYNAAPPLQPAGNFDETASTISLRVMWKM